ncbi:MAG: glycosyltransferase [Thermodesulfobacteriota bacterium]
MHTTSVEKIDKKLSDKKIFRFAVTGNVNNSVRIFQDQIVPMINNNNFDFTVSAGNAVNGGEEESYRAVYEIFENLNMPCLFTYGENEDSDFGAFRFYEHFGPHFYSFVSGGNHFIFLDSTGKTSYRWQLNWLKRELESDVKNRFVFIHNNILETKSEAEAEKSSNSFTKKQFFKQLRELFASFRVDAVFSAEKRSFSKKEAGGTIYVSTGAAGGILTDDEKFHHYTDVTVNNTKVDITPEKLEADIPGSVRIIDSILDSIYSFFYVSYLRFILLISILFTAAIKLHSLIAEEKKYYPDYTIDSSPYTEKPLKTAMFSNNYYPFVSGISVSVNRLEYQLKKTGNKVISFVPEYKKNETSEDGVIRLSCLYSFGSDEQFKLANIFSRKVFKEIKKFKPDIIHVHHPFWLGSLGLWIGRRSGIPVVYTYHTRLEHYAHYVPVPGLIFKNIISHSMIKRFCNKCSGVIVPTYSAEEYLRIIGVKTDLLVQPTGIEYEKFKNPDKTGLQKLRKKFNINSETVLVTASRISEEKNIEFIIHGAAKLKKETDAPFKLLIIGDGPDMEKIKKLINELDLSSQIILTGGVAPEKMNLYYNLGDIFVFASKSETQGLVILEAMSAGLPVVAVRSSGIDDIVKNNVNGFKTPENYEKWCGCIKEMIEYENLRSKLSSGALKCAKNYDTKYFAENIKEFYGFLLAKKENRSG